MYVDFTPGAVRAALLCRLSSASLDVMRIKLKQCVVGRVMYVLCVDFTLDAVRAFLLQV